MSAAILKPQAPSFRCTVGHLLLSNMLYYYAIWFAYALLCTSSGLHSRMAQGIPMSHASDCVSLWIHSSLQRQAGQPFRTARVSPAAPRSRRHLQCRAGNVLLELLGSGVGAAAVTAVTTFTSENRDAEIERLQVFEVLALALNFDAA